MIVAKTFTITSYGKSKEYPESQRKKTPCSDKCTNKP